MDFNWFICIYQLFSYDQKRVINSEVEDENMIMQNMVFRRALDHEMSRIIAMQTDVFNGEQSIPSEDIGTFMAKKPICWCVESGGKIYAATAAWKEDNKVHWGRFVVFPAARGLHIGTKLARFSFAELFSDGVDEIYMDARDTTLKIVCGMGGKIVGKPYKFYEGNVTPVILKKADFISTQ